MSFRKATELDHLLKAWPVLASPPKKQVAEKPARTAGTTLNARSRLKLRLIALAQKRS